MLRIKLGETTGDNARMIRDMVKAWRNGISERSDKRLHHHVHLKKAAGLSKNFFHVWLNIPERDLK